MKSVLAIVLSCGVVAACSTAWAEETKLAATSAVTATTTSGISLKTPDDAIIDRLVAAAPKAPYLDPALGARLVDFIDCSKSPADDPHPFAGDNQGRVTAGSMGAYRETGTYGNSWFAYRFRTGTKQAPHLVLVEYPDDDNRTALVFMHEPWMSGNWNSDFHVECGYWTGREVPNSGRFQALELWLWPTERWPAVVLMNHTKTQRAAASRIWVYEITGGLPAAQVHEPADLPKRQVGVCFEDSRTYRFNFGSYGDDGSKRLVDYLKYAGQNLLAFDVVLYNWNKCSVPAFEGNPGGGDPTEQALAACDRAGIDFLAVFDPMDGYKIKGLTTGNLTDDAVIDAWVEGLGQFADKYGRHPSLKGLSFGGPAGCNRFRSPKIDVLQEKLRAMLQKKRPDLTLHVFFGNEFLHSTIFNAKGYEPYNAVIAPWEAAPPEKNFAGLLAESVDRYWRQCLHMNIEDLRGKPGLVVHRSFYPNDQRCFEHYPYQTPRFMIYRDYTRSQQVSEALANGGAEGACLFGSYFEMEVPLWAPKNFWWERTWVGPHMPAGGDHALAAYTEPLYQRDYPVMLQSTWTDPLVGHPSQYRSFAQAFRTLPAKPFETMRRDNYVAVRRLSAGGATWFYVLNNHWSPARIHLTLKPAAGVVDLVSGEAVALADGGLEVTLPPYGLRTFKADGAAVTINGVTIAREATAYEHLRSRVAAYASNLAALKQAVPDLSGKFAAALDEARGKLGAGNFEAADRALPDVLGEELQLRLWMTKDRPKIVARKATRPIRVDGNLDDWQGVEPAAVINTADNLVNDHHFGHQWKGPENLSATVWAAYDETNLMLAVRVRKDAVCGKDGVQFQFSANYRSLAEGERSRGDRDFRVAAPTSDQPVEVRHGQAVLVSCRTADGYAVKASIPLAYLGLKPGQSTGLHLVLTEANFPDHPLPQFFWNRTQHMEWPVNPWWCWDRDAQCAGELHLEK